ncbi:MAG: 2-isopropylmalate synthase, partial [Corynebacterium humireducens]|nr:2-isopropylmalate synthase [Corynebacterium humireducens]
SQQSRSSGDDAEAACYIYATVNGSAAWGVGIAGSITRASIKALTSAVNRALRVEASVLAGGV